MLNSNNPHNKNLNTHTAINLKLQFNHLSITWSPVKEEHFCGKAATELNQSNPAFHNFIKDRLVKVFFQESDLNYYSLPHNDTIKINITVNLTTKNFPKL